MEAGSFHRSADWQSPVSRFKKRRAVCPSVFVCAACACVEVICIHFHCAVALFCLIWARCSLPAITWHCRVHSRCVFLSAPLGAYVIAQCWWEQPWLRVPSHTAITLMVVQEKNTVKIKKVPGAARQVRDYGLSLLLLSPEEADRGLKVSHLLRVKEFLSC